MCKIKVEIRFSCLTSILTCIIHFYLKFWCIFGTEKRCASNTPHFYSLCIYHSFCMCVYLLCFFVPIGIFLSIFIAISIFSNLNWGEVQPWCSRSHFPFCWWTMEIQYRLLAHILNLLNVSVKHIKIIVGIFERVACIEHLNEWILNILTHIVKIEHVQPEFNNTHILCWFY